ncbi:hypothetical protein HW555_010961 [Spodoptera exigua]|uniref:Uncharacterized protein n=1 Tax=Spodoptera exigua TaxID=7107 RepID=A0A835L233_SPOEX|nr:hypothetical protein HW555_010961 [Spodoptera exigua]
MKNGVIATLHLEKNKNKLVGSESTFAQKPQQAARDILEVTANDACADIPGLPTRILPIVLHAG